MDEDNPYESPKDTSTGPGPNILEDASRPRGWRSSDFTFVVAQNGIFLGLSALVPDGGIFLQLCLAIVIWHWIGVALILMRRRTAPTRLDVAMVRFGFLIALFLVVPTVLTVHILWILWFLR
jgi:hypothetical protein